MLKKEINKHTEDLVLIAELTLLSVCVYQASFLVPSAAPRWHAMPFILDLTDEQAKFHLVGFKPSVLILQTC